MTVVTSATLAKTLQTTDSWEVANKAVADYAVHGLGEPPQPALASDTRRGVERAVEAQVAAKLSAFIHDRPAAYLERPQALERVFQAKVAKLADGAQAPTLELPEPIDPQNADGRTASKSDGGSLEPPDIPSRTRVKISRLTEDLQEQQARLADQQQQRGDAHKTYAENRVEMGFAEKHAGWLRRTGRVADDANRSDQIAELDAGIRETKQKIDALETARSRTLVAALRMDPLFPTVDKELGELRQLRLAVADVQRCLDNVSEAPAGSSSKSSAGTTAEQARQQVAARMPELWRRLEHYGVVVVAQPLYGLDPLAASNAVSSALTVLGVGPSLSDGGPLDLAMSVGNPSEQVSWLSERMTRLADAVTARTAGLEQVRQERIDQALAACLD